MVVIKLCEKSDVNSMGMHPGAGLKASNIKGLAVLHFAFGARISFV
jgi:hypothetical protein